MESRSERKESVMWSEIPVGWLNTITLTLRVRG